MSIYVRTDAGIECIKPDRSLEEVLAAKAEVIPECVQELKALQIPSSPVAVEVTPIQPPISEVLTNG